MQSKSEVREQGLQAVLYDNLNQTLYGLLTYCMKRVRVVGSLALRAASTSNGKSSMEANSSLCMCPLLTPLTLQKLCLVELSLG